MTAASPAAPPSVADPSINSHAPSHNVNLPRFHPIAINPNGAGPGSASGPSSFHRPYGAPILDYPTSHHAPTGPLPPPLSGAPAPHQLQYQQQQQPQQHTPQSGPPSRPASHPPLLPVPITTQLDQIEVRLRQIEQEEANRAAARAHMLAMRRREDEEFRMVTERAEAEEEDLRRRRKRLKRESMGLMDGQIESPPAPTARRLSETSAATTLAFFKQQSPPEPRPPELRAPPPPPPSHHHHHQPPPPPVAASAPMIQQPIPLSSAPPSTMANGHSQATGTFRKKQKYTIKNAEAWGERHGRPATYDAAGRALWKRPSDGQLVYLDCPAPDCGKSDFVTLHGFMCHLTKKHKDRSMGSQSRALDLCGSIFDPNAPRPQRPSLKRGSSAVNSRAGSEHTEEAEVEDEEDAYSVAASDMHEATTHNSNHNFGPDAVVKKEETDSPVVAAAATATASNTTHDSNESTSSNKASIASMIDSNVPTDNGWVPKKSSIPMGEGGSTAPSTEVSAQEEAAAAAAVLAGQSALNEVHV